MIRVPVVVVLDTMWGRSGKAPGYFRINPCNASGRRLYDILGSTKFLVMNACREQVSSADAHGVPDPAWLCENLQRVRCDILLVCGKVAQTTYAQCGYVPPEDALVLFMKHPAARDWCHADVSWWNEKIRSLVLRPA